MDIQNLLFILKIVFADLSLIIINVLKPLLNDDENTESQGFVLDCGVFPSICVHAV